MPTAEALSVTAVRHCDSLALQLCRLKEKKHGQGRRDGNLEAEIIQRSNRGRDIHAYMPRNLQLRRPSRATGGAPLQPSSSSAQEADSVLWSTRQLAPRGARPAAAQARLVGDFFFLEGEGAVGSHCVGSEAARRDEAIGVRGGVKA